MIKFQLPDMTCGHCASRVAQALKLADPECKVQVDLAARKVQVQASEDRETLADALAAVGYPPA